MTTIYRDLVKNGKRSALLCLAYVLAPVLLTGCVKGPISTTEASWRR